MKQNKNKTKNKPSVENSSHHRPVKGYKQSMIIYGVVSFSGLISYECGKEPTTVCESCNFTLGVGTVGKYD